MKFVDWDNDLIAGDTDGDEYIVILLNKYGRYLGSDAFANFQLHTYTDIALDHPWTFFEQLEPLTVHYDGGIDLLGLALGQIEQLPSQQPLNLGLERSLWVNLRWQTIPGLDTDFAVSLRLHNAEGASSYQKDFVLGNSTFARTRHWPPDEAVDTLFRLELPADLAPGEYELRLNRLQHRNPDTDCRDRCLGAGVAPGTSAFGGIPITSEVEHGWTEAPHPGTRLPGRARTRRALQR